MRRFAFLFALGLAFGGAGRALASGINVSPVQIDLSRGSTRGELSIRNDGSEASRFQVTVFTWSEDPEKGMQLAPTQDIIFFPALLSLKPGETRVVRVGAMPANFGLVEKTYRIFISELPPPPQAGARKSQVRVLTRVGVPIFLEPARTVEGRKLALRTEPNTVVADLRNDGNVHFRATDLTAKGFDAQGNAVFEKQEQGWYVLPGDHKLYRFVATPGSCGQIRKVIVVVHTADERTMSEQLDTPAGLCGKP